MAFSPSEIAFEGFRLTREKPAVIGFWSLAHLVLAMVGGVAVTYVLGADLQTLQTFNPGENDIEALNAMLPLMGKLYALVIPLALVSGALFTCAALRAVLRPQDRAFGYLRLGKDEFLMVVLYVVLFLIYALVLTGVSIGVVLIASGLGMLIGGGAAVGLLAGVLVFVGLIGSMVWLMVRLSLAPAMTFTRGKLHLAEAWAMTRGRFWPLLGTYFISWVLSAVVWLLGMAVVFGVAAVVGGGFGAIGQVMAPDTSSVAALFTPVALVSTVCSAVITALQTAILKTPPALAYRELSEGGTVDTFA